MFRLVPRTQSRNGVAPFEHPIDRLFQGFFNGFPAAQPSAPQWGGNLKETEKEYVVTLDAPGFEANEFDIQVSDEGLTVSAEHVVKEGEESRTERSLKRQVTLPTPVDTNKVEAKYRNGVLELRLPKAEAERWKKIEVKSE